MYKVILPGIVKREDNNMNGAKEVIEKTMNPLGKNIGGTGRFRARRMIQQTK